MMEFDEAQAQLAKAADAITRREILPLASLAGRVLAQDIQAGLDLPPADNSAMDGYALRYADYEAGRALPVSQRIFAGDMPAVLPPGQAARLFTGSLMPPGADTVVMQEDTRETDGKVEILQPPRAGQHVRKRGEDTTAGQALLAAGTVLQASHIALLASQGLAQAEVYGRLRVGILTTGDELVFPGSPRQDQQIYNSNGAMLAALAEGMGAEATHVLHARDEQASLNAAFARLLQDCDLVLSVGGVSVGERDLVKPVLEAMGATLVLWKVRMKPGKPVALAHIQGKPLVCLPGNPVSAYAVFTVLVSPLVRRMQGRSTTHPRVDWIPLRTEHTRRDGREEFLRVQYDAGQAPQLHPYAKQGSGVMSSLPWASGLARLPYDTDISDGTAVRYYDFRYWQS
ncbi:gephyrin-like molybdotransferase Glp [Bordetella holmesii]|uniref:Molybdopterin molybdenumtransferase n=2 Tax=Bordetella holmesii TaxID=35814 RepID=A0A158M5P0_9BORD|nr:gephyrin-like molybdotransferase Glp [Bordetella holmesii]AHV94104.1 molybdenum cofactor synthesis domain protein [Bordetella holmesii ATCC 51541]EWM48109.1 molybdenum cofactor synthesis domain protein [Bordetella holmesii 35009]AMD46339.1 molybdopterin biosynthesis protein MoeA [Bordetella holmesii H558]AMD48269.1 molybdopterin biosynthesis protein MoeA [Bordetella holmesii F627]AOB35232.1 molybdopterin molybdenumtransferase MoeA [Bordetella holmesii]